jgi:hypothetical protein
MVTTKTATLAADRRGYQRSIATVSLVVGPLIMAIGDLLHPQESSNTDRQAAMIVGEATRWYLAHLLLLVGFALVLPGLLAATGLVAARWPKAGYAARVLILTGATGTAGIFAVEAVAGRLALVGPAATKSILDTLFSAPVAVPIFAIALCFFVGVIVLTVPVIGRPGPGRWPAVTLLVGILLILAEITSSQVLLSQLGNVLVWLGSVGFAVLLHRGEASPQRAHPDESPI